MVGGNIILSVSKAMEVLQILSRADRPLLLKEVSALCGYPKSTVFSLLTTMRTHDVVTQTPDGRYALGVRLFEYGQQVEALVGYISLGEALYGASVPADRRVRHALVLRGRQRHHA